MNTKQNGFSCNIDPRLFLQFIILAITILSSCSSNPPKKINESENVTVALYDSYKLHIKILNPYLHTSDTSSDNTMDFTPYHHFEIMNKGGDTPMVEFHFNLREKFNFDTLSSIQCKQVFDKERQLIMDLHYKAHPDITSSVLNINGRKYYSSVYKYAFLKKPKIYNSSMFLIVGGHGISLEFKYFSDSMQLHQIMNSLSIDKK